MQTVFICYSQDTIPITLQQAKAAINNAIKVEGLQEQVTVQQLIIKNQHQTISALNQQMNAEKLKFQLLQSNYKITENQLYTVTNTKSNHWFTKALVIVGVFATGYMVGSL